MPFVAPISRQSLLGGRLTIKAASGLTGLLGLAVFSAVFLVAAEQWSDARTRSAETSAESALVATEQWGLETARLLTAHQGLTGVGLLFNSPSRD